MSSFKRRWVETGHTSVFISNPHDLDIISAQSSSAVCHLSACQKCTAHSRLLDFVNVAFFDEEVVYFARLVHVYLDEWASLRQSETTLPLTLVQQGLFVLQVRTGHEAHHLAQLGGKKQKKVLKKKKIVVHLIMQQRDKGDAAEYKRCYTLRKEN